MTLTEFLNQPEILAKTPTDALKAAREHFVESWRKIGANEAVQLFSVYGAIDALEDAIVNPLIKDIEVVIEEQSPTTVGQLCFGILSTLKNGAFATDPTGDDGGDGQANRVSAAKLVEHGVFSQYFVDTFFSRAKVVTYPLQSTTLAQVKAHRGTLVYKPVTAQNGWAKITTTADCEPHNPQIFVEIMGVKQRVAGFRDVEKSGDYLAQVPVGYSQYFVADSYEVIA